MERMFAVTVRAESWQGGIDILEMKSLVDRITKTALVVGKGKGEGWYKA